MKELLETIRDWQAEGVGFGRAVVVRTFGSAPRPEGAVLLRADDGRIAGSVSGGCVEGAAAEEIERARADGRSRVIRYGISDEQAWDVGLACGGTIDVLVEPQVDQRIVDAAGNPGATGSLTGALGDPILEGRLVEESRDALERGTSHTVDLGGRSLFVEAFPVKPRLVVVGAVQVAQPLVRIARELGYETVVVDGRASFATESRFPDVDRLIVGWPDEIADEIGLGPSDAVAILSHDVKFDEPAIMEALRRRCRYVGAIGSRKTQADRRARLLAAGVPEDDLARLHGPIGLDLGGRAPAETALAIMSEVVAARYGGSGRSMRDKARPEPVPA
jgi:xanthine dehydrogenase accessory factor